MGTEVYEKTLSLGKLYKTGQIIGSSTIGAQVYPNIWINSGTISVYGSGSKTMPTALSEMTLNAENTGVAGHNMFAFVPKWIAITQATGTTTELVSYGINAVDMGAIS